MEFINDETLLRLNINILTIGYLEKEAFCLIEVIKNNKKIMRVAKR